MKGGDLEILGREDDQVKVHGVRIELSEVRAALYELSGIDRVELLVHQGEDNNRELLCYYTGVARESEQLRASMAELLPKYYLPSHYLWLESFPLTLNGKVDRKKLPRPEWVLGGPSFEAPKGELEVGLAALWGRVLDRKEIGRADDFFSLGGSSLKVIQLISAIYKQYEVQLSIGEIFSHRSLVSQAGLIEAATHTAYQAIEQVAPQDSYELSPSQLRLWMMDQLNPDQITYNISKAAKLEGYVDVDRLHSTFIKLIQRHEILRTSFDLIDERVVQYVSEEVEFTIAQYKADQDQVPDILSEFIRPFDLKSDLLLRVGLIEISSTSHILVFDMHHIISDEISLRIMIEEFMALYNDEKLADVNLQYKDYAAWVNSESQQEKLKQHREFWLKEFADEISPLQLPIDFIRPVTKSFLGDSISFELEKAEFEHLKTLCEKEGVTIFMMTLGLFTVLLSKLGNTEDLVVGTPVAGRPHSDLENMLGVFVNTLCIRNYPKGEMSFQEYLSDVKAKTLACFENESYPFEELINDLQVERDTSHNPLFDVMFNYQNVGTESTELVIPGLKLSSLGEIQQTSKFDLSLWVVEKNETIFFQLEYSTELFKRTTAKRILTYFQNIINELTVNPEVKLSAVDISSEKEKNQILYEFNTIDIGNSNQETLISLFEKQVERTPENIAYIFDGQEMTYRQLDERANRLAHRFRKKGIIEETLVPICLRPGLDMMVAIIGILKAGAAYVPVNPELPQELINYMVEDTNANFTVFSRETKAKFHQFSGINMLTIEDELAGNGVPTTPLDIDILPEQLAYVIYTSGSSGRPKGVMIEHQSLVNYLQNNKTRYLDEQNEGAGTYMHLSYAFDASLTGIFMPLLAGKSTVIASRDGADVFEDPAFMEYAPYDFIKMTPYHLTLIGAQYEHTGMPFPTKRLVVGGASLYQHHLKFLEEGIEVINEYGPTEATVGCTTYQYFTKNTDEDHRQIPIGSPIDNVQIYILDSRQELLPVGVPGELYIGGNSLARAYLNQPRLTAEKFVQNPFNEASRLYRTGDFARWLPDGNIEFQGRMDEQVKIRGFRVEPGEIENSLLAYEKISEAVVVLDSHSGEDRLVGYYVSEEELDIVDIRMFLAKRLAEYMIPDYYQRVERIPLTPNGKVNKKLLPVPQLILTDTYHAPASQTERKVDSNMVRGSQTGCHL